jgi:hypothetical protein
MTEKKNKKTKGLASPLGLRVESVQTQLLENTARLVTGGADLKDIVWLLSPFLCDAVLANDALATVASGDKALARLLAEQLANVKSGHVLCAYTGHDSVSVLMAEIPLKMTEDDFCWKQWHTDILAAVDVEPDPIAREDIAEQMVGYPADRAAWTFFPRALNQLVRNGHLRRLTTGYVITPKGKTILERPPCHARAPGPHEE